MSGVPRSRTLAIFRRALRGTTRNVANAAADDPARLDRVRRLLRAHKQVQESSFLAIDDPDGTTARAERAQLASMRGRCIGPYTVIDVLGEGGMGVVYRAHRQRPFRTVALKVIQPHLACPQMLANFGRETAALRRLCHPCIARIHEAGSADVDGHRVHFIAMEMIEGQTLMTYAGACSTPELLQLFERICDAVGYAHAHGVVHCDLKPDNIVVEMTPVGALPRVLDFGIACVTTSDGDPVCPNIGAGQMLGTLRYMSPEQCEGDATRLDARTDIYALGVILLELLNSPDPPDRGLPDDLEAIVARTLQPDRDQRYASVSDLIVDIRHVLDGEPIETTRAT